MSAVITLAEAVAETLADFHAEVLFFPEFELRDIEEMKVIVVPLAEEFKPLSRTQHEDHHPKELALPTIPTSATLENC